jgi:TetR/AcrR family transcriptional regulator
MTRSERAESLSQRPGRALKRRVGRPRANGRGPSASPREDVLQAAGRLFAERGFLGTSTAQIAAAAGLRQSAIFHWFRSKESILETLFAQGWDRSLEYFGRIAATRLPGAVKFCLCLSYDARLVAGAEPHIQLMIVPPELRQPRFRRLLEKRQRLISYLEGFIRQAMREGDFRANDPEQTARMVLAIDEVVLDVARTRRPRSPGTHAEAVMEFALHGLISQRGRMAAIRALTRRAAARGRDRGRPSPAALSRVRGRNGRSPTPARAARSRE